MINRLNLFHLFAILILSILVGLALRQKFGSDLWELAGFVTGVVGVYLAAVEHIINWPIGILNVLIYAWVFHAANLQADMSLQFIYLVLGIQGWWQWAQIEKRSRQTPCRSTISKNPHQSKTITHLDLKIWIYLAVMLGVGTAIYYRVVVYIKGASPFLDSILTVASIEGQILLNLKKIENWIIWIVVDATYIPLYLSRHLVPTAVLYFLLFILAVLGYCSWSKTLKLQQQTA